MLEPLYRRTRGDSRAVLVAYSISPSMRALCERYCVECYEVPERVVHEWHERHAELVAALMQPWSDLWLAACAAHAPENDDA